MKALTLIPKKIKDTYQIEKYKNSLKVYKPAYVNIDFDENFRIRKNEINISIENKKCIVTLWRKIIRQHITLY